MWWLLLDTTWLGTIFGSVQRAITTASDGEIGSQAAARADLPCPCRNKRQSPPRWAARVDLVMSRRSRREEETRSHMPFGRETAMRRLPGLTVPLTSLAVVILAGFAGTAAQTPTNLRVEGIPRNRHVLTHTPQFCWDYTGTQANWQIEVDDDPNFDLNYNNNPSGAVLFWESGTQDKGTNDNTRCATL